jgi:propionyl-CoA synthetase
MTRVDDVINTCGHRISTGRLEEAVNEHSLVVESAVVGYDEDLRGECPLAYVILRGKGVEGMDIKEVNKISSSINDQIRKDVGAFCRLIGVIFVEKLPKTRSGKILRGTIRKICNDNPYVMPATIDDPAVLEQIKVATAEWKKTLK